MYYVGQTVLVKKTKYPAIVVGYMSKKDEEDAWSIRIYGRGLKKSECEMYDVDYLFNGDSTILNREMYRGKYSTNKIFAPHLNLVNKSEVNKYLTDVNKAIKEGELQTKVYKKDE